MGVIKGLPIHQASSGVTVFVTLKYNIELLKTYRQDLYCQQSRCIIGRVEACLPSCTRARICLDTFVRVAVHNANVYAMGKCKASSLQG